MRAPVRRAVRVRHHARGGAPNTPLLAVSAVVCLAVVGAVAFALLPPAESGSGPEPKGVKASAAQDTANVTGAWGEGPMRRPEPRPARRRSPARAPTQEVAAPVVPEAPAVPAPAPAPPVASPPTADEAQPVEGDETPARPDFDLDAAPGAPGRGVPEEDRVLEAPPAEPAPAPDEPPAPPAGEPIPAQPEVPEAPPAPAPEPPAAP